LDRVQPLAKNEHAENDVHERIDEVAEARFDDPFSRDAEDVGGPVDRDERRARDEPQSNLWVRQRPAYADELASKRKPPKRKQAPPYDTVRRHLQDGYTLERFEIKRQQAPNGERTRSGGQSAQVDGGVGGKRDGSHGRRSLQAARLSQNGDCHSMTKHSTVASGIGRRRLLAVACRQ